MLPISGIVFPAVASRKNSFRFRVNYVNLFPFPDQGSAVLQAESERAHTAVVVQRQAWAEVGLPPQQTSHAWSEETSTEGPGPWLRSWIRSPHLRVLAGSWTFVSGCIQRVHCAKIHSPSASGSWARICPDFREPCLRQCWGSNRWLPHQDQTPLLHRINYLNYNGFFSLNMQAICNSDGSISWYFCWLPRVSSWTEKKRKTAVFTRQNGTLPMVTFFWGMVVVPV